MVSLDSIVIICVSILVVLSLCFMLMNELGIPDLFSCDVCLAIVLLVYLCGLSPAEQ